MAVKSILFDLDGTLTDSGEGITNCAKIALEHFGISVPDPQALTVFIGPPLRDTFPKFGVPAEGIEEAVRCFREHYVTTGKFQNALYDGIPSLLDTLKKQGHKLYVATSKPEIQALEILEHFGILPYFDAVCGASLDGKRDNKASVIDCLLSQIEPTEEIVMVGDTEFDVLGAAAHHIPTIGVAWGFGKIENMEKAGVRAIAETTDQLVTLINNKTWGAI